MKLLTLLSLLSAAALADKAPPEVTLEGHTGTVVFVAFSPDGKRLVSAGEDGSVKVWDLAAKKLLASAGDMLTNANQARFSPDGKSVATISSSNEVVILDALTGKALRTFPIAGIPGGPHSLDLSPDGKTIAVAGRGELRLLAFADGTKIASYEVHKSHDVTGVTWSSDGKSLATTGSDHTALILNAADGKLIKTCNISYDGGSVAFSKDAKTLFITSSDRALRICEPSSDEAKPVIERGVVLTTLATSADGKKVIIGGAARSPWIWSVADHKLVEPELDSEAGVKSAAISPDGKWLAGGANGGPIYLWKMP